MRRTPSILALTILCSALAFGAVRRVGQPRLAFCGSTDEFSEFMPGLRLHALPLWNLGADIRSNFFTSLVYSPHGFGDSVFYYLATGGLHALGLSISDRHLWLASAFTNGLLAAAVACLALLVARSPAMASVAVLLIALSPLYVFSSQTAFGRITFVPLVQVVALLLAALAHRRPRWTTRAALVLAAFFIELTDGFYFGPVLLVFLFLQQSGSARDRAAATLRDRTWWWTAGAIAAGLAVDVGLGALAAARDTTLTLFGYVRTRVGYGGMLSIGDLLRLLMQAIQKYTSIAGPAVVIPAWLVASRYAWSEPLAGALAAWFAIAMAGVLRYYASAPGPEMPNVGALTAYPLALPSYLVVAWACGRGLRSGAFGRAAAAVGCVAVAIPLAAMLATERYDADLQVRKPRYAQELDKCLAMKAASVYTREKRVAGATVFHLGDDPMLGIAGEFYYGLSYVGNNHTGERNRIVDFGTQAFHRRYTPEQLARAYGVPHFTYYVEFAPIADAFTADAVRRLAEAGAKPALEIRDRGRVLGRVWRFDAPDAEVMEVAEVAERWDRVGHLPRLFEQSLAGTAYHFGAVWPRPDG